MLSSLPRRILKTVRKKACFVIAMLLQIISPLLNQLYFNNGQTFFAIWECRLPG